MDDKIISTLKLKRALNSLKSKFISTKGGTMEGDFNIDALYLKINTASGYRQAFGTIRGGLLALGSDELPAALYGYDKNQKPQWVYKEGSNYVFKDLALKDDIEVLTGSLVSGTGKIGKTVTYPDGFTRDNCTVVSIMYSGGQYTPTSYITVNDITNSTLFQINLNASNIYIGVDFSKLANNSGGNVNTVQYRVVLMKI